MNADYRVGVGYDIHRLAEGRRLIVGGVEIDHPLGLVGHSDADVVLHAVTDALLGAAGLPDIGEMFPDDDPAYRDADSGKLLREAMENVRQAGYRASNIDVVIHAEQPKLTPYKRRIAASIASLTGLEPPRVSVKAKTNEGMGPLGYSDAMACTAVAAVVRSG
ncbi:MAG: 2-C-methyl-D-erythritol 2,4-cyclodiphosphate synthase [Planctomycetota bacterium]|nr:MAG: 2-C-methyl-D-erythritol 2,4-cyclodiphosphate synthase [Planctomycetota bacterium]